MVIILIRDARNFDLDGLQELYLHLHESEKLPETPELNSLWNEIIADEDYHILIGEIEDKIVSSVTVVIIKNLTRGMRPYALIENVATHKDYRCRGYAQALMQRAINIAKRRGCYKIMLLTGAKNENTLRFYEKCGLTVKIKLPLLNGLRFRNMILSASRRTDILAYYSQWLINRLHAGFVLTRNPMNHAQVSRIALSADVIDCIVFWTKDPLNMLGKLDVIDKRDYLIFCVNENCLRL